MRRSKDFKRCPRTIFLDVGETSGAKIDEDQTN